MRLYLIGGLMLLSVLWVACSSGPPVTTTYEARLDSTTVEAVTDLSEAKRSTVSDLSELKVRWRVRCAGQAGQCSRETVTAILQYVGRDLEYSPDVQLELWTSESSTYEKLWDGYSTDRTAELGRGLSGQGFQYSLPASSLETLTQKPKVRLAVSDEGDRSMYRLTDSQVETIRKFLDAVQ
jgi:hypothetical protein